MVTCSGLDCSICSLLELIQNIFNWLLGTAGAAAALSIVLAGIIYLVSSGNNPFLLKAKRFFVYSIVGFALVLMSFLIFNTTYFVLGASNKSSWFKIDCSEDKAIRDKSQNKTQNTQKIWTSNLTLSIVNGSSVQSTVYDSQKVTKLDFTNFDSNNLVLDSIGLDPGRELKLIAAEKSQNIDEILNYIRAGQGFSVSGERSDSSGDRMAENNLGKEFLTISKGDQGALVVSNNDQEIIVDISNNKSMDEFRKFLKNTLAQFNNNDKNIYAFSDVGQEDYAAGDMNTCEESGGSWITFKNECAARQAVCGQGEIQCSDTKNDNAGCLCPKGSCLQYGKCVGVGETRNGSDGDGDGVTDSIDHCPKTPKGEKVDQGNSADKRGCSCSQIPLKSRECPASRCEGSNLIRYSNTARDKCSNGKIIKNPCNQLDVQYSQQCQELQKADSINAMKQIASQNTNTASATQKWLNDLSKAMSGNSSVSKPNDKVNDWEKTGTDEGGAPSPTGPKPGPSSSDSSQGPSQNEQSDSSGTQTQPDTTDTPKPSDTSTGGSEEARALAQKLVKIPEGILANNSDVTPYTINECIPKLQQAAVELNKIKPGWKIHPSSIYRSDEKQTQMWDRSSKNEKKIAKPKARGGRGSQHSSGNALDLKFKDVGGRIPNMKDNAPLQALLRQVMESAGMIPYDAEWWHFYCIKPFRF